MKASAEPIVITCEHGGRRVPPELRAVFRGHAALLRSHAGWDPGALLVARHLARALGAPLHAVTVSRLVVDTNRSRHHPRLFSMLTRPLDGADRARILARYYLPFRGAVESALARRIAAQGSVLHLSVHSFTPELDGERRDADIGILYDPRRRAEARFARRLRAALQQCLPGLRVRCNYPYRGSADGFTTHLRGRHGAGQYAGIELELNQHLVARPAATWRAVRRGLTAALHDAIAT